MAVNPSPISPKTKSKLSSLIIMISAASALGLLAAIGIWQYLTQTQEKVKELTVTRAVVVASKEIPVGTKLTDEYLAIKQFPAKAIPQDYPKSVEEVKGRVAKNALQKDEIITAPRLVAEGAAGGLPMVIPPKHRAITIKVTEISGVAGFIAPGDHVDILATLSKSEEQTVSKTILQNVLVLAVGDKILDPTNIADSHPTITSQVTVAITPSDAEKLSLASQTGELNLVLRPLGDDKILSTEGSILQDVYGEIAAKEDPALTSQAPAVSEALKNLNSVEIISGDEKSYFYY